MWIRTQNKKSFIETTGWHIYVEDIEFQEVKSYTINATRNNSEFILLAKYDNKKLRDTVMEMFETALLGNQNVFSFEDIVIYKYMKEFEKKMKG